MRFTMTDIFIKYLQDKITLSEEEADVIRAVCIEKKLRKKQFLLEEGDKWTYNAFVCRGFLKTLFVDSNGQDLRLNGGLNTPDSNPVVV